MAEKSRRSKVDYRNVRAEAGQLIRDHRKTLTIGMILMVINRLCGLVLPAMPKYLMDNVIGQRRSDLLWPLIGVAALASIVQAITSFSLSQVVSVAAQGAINKMRKEIQA